MTFTPHQKAVLAFSDILCRADGSRRPPAEAVEQYGGRAVTWAEIYEALAERLQRPADLSVPRRIFVSYRWGNDAQNRWVEELAAKLEARGNEVVFDRDVARQSPGIPIVKLVSQIADCSLFLMIVDPGYIERVPSLDQELSSKRSSGWAWDEYALWRGLVYELRLPGLALLREGTELLRHTTFVANGGWGNIVDVREDESLDPVLDTYFMPVAAPPNPAVARQAASLLHQSGLESRKGNWMRAMELARAAAALIPELPDAHARLATLALILGRGAEAHDAARRALAIDSQKVLLYFLAGAAACAAGEYEEAVGTVGPVAPTDPKSWRPHLIIAQALAELGQLGSARAHRDLAFANHTELRTALSLLHGASDADAARAIDRTREMFDQRGAMRIIEPYFDHTGTGFFTTYLEPPPELPQRAAAVDIDVALVRSASRSEAFMRLGARN